jgi:hypothetical protein
MEQYICRCEHILYIFSTLNRVVVCREEYVGYPEEYNISNNQSNNNSHSIPPPPVGLTNPVFMRTGTPVHGLLSRGGGGVSNPLLAGPGRNTPGMDSLGGPGRDTPGGPGRDTPGGLGRPNDRSSAASSSHALSDLVVSSGGGRNLSPGGRDWSHQPLDSEGEEGDQSPSPPAVQCYSTAVQTVAPSATASLMRQQNRLRNVSLV